MRRIWCEIIYLKCSTDALLHYFSAGNFQSYANQFGQGYAIRRNQFILIIYIIWQNKVQCSTESSLEIRYQWALYVSSRPIQRIVILVHWQTIFPYSISDVWSTRHWHFWQANWLTGPNRVPWWTSYRGELHSIAACHFSREQLPETSWHHRCEIAHRRTSL